MPRTDRPYSRVYWEVTTDAKFADVWDDDHALATWLRLLIAADAIWNASPTLYHGINWEALQKLVDAGLVDLEGASRYRIHGLDKEREARRAQAQRAVNSRTDRSATPVPTPVVPSQDETRRDETSQDEKGTDVPALDAADHLDAWYQLTGSWPTPKVIPWLDDLARTYGSDRLITALAEECAISPDRRDLLSRTGNRLGQVTHHETKAAENARRERERAAERAERERIESMPLEQRKANLTRLRESMATAGLIAEKGTTP